MARVLGPNRHSEREIRLTNGMTARVSPEDFGRLKGYVWGFDGRYARRTTWENGKQKKTYMHREVLGFPVREVDHINRDKLDNRRANLRLVSRSENMFNTSKRLGTSSRFKGVCFSPHLSRSTPWRAYVTLNGKQTSLGYFPSEQEAAKAVQTHKSQAKG